MQHPLETVLVADALRRLPDGRARLLDDRTAMARALQSEATTPEQQLHAWIRGLQCFEPLISRCRDQLRTTRHAIWVLFAVALVLGWAAASSPLGGRDTVNIAFLLATLVALPTLLLIVWAVLLLWAQLLPSRGTSGGLLARAPLQLTQLLRRRAAAEEQATLASSARLLGTAPVGPWLFSTITHGFWLAFATGACVSLTLRLITQQYDFVWGTTLIDEHRAADLLLALAWLPQQLGLSVPTADVLQASRQGSPDAGQHRQLWGQFALISVLLYVLLPRLLLAGLSLLLTRRALAHLRLDQSQPLIQRALLQLRQALQPAAPPTDRPADGLQPVAPVQAATPGQADYFVCIGLELDPDDPHWPPEPDHWQVLCLDNVQGRSSARRAREQLTALAPRPRFLLIVANLQRTPDRGSIDLLCELANTAAVPARIWLVDTGAAGNREDSAALQRRIWQERLQAAGFERVDVGDWETLLATPQATLAGAANLLESSS